jgi:hypothetical protein
MDNLAGASPSGERVGLVVGRKGWLGLAGAAVVLLLGAILLGGPSWALPVERALAAPGDSPQPAVALGAISGQVFLEARPAPPTDSWSIPLQVTLFRDDGAVYTSTVVTTDNEGAFTLSGIAVDVYDVWVKGAHTLAERQNDISVVESLPVHLEFGPLIEGDANNDNQIGAVDASFLSDGYWKIKGEAGFVTGADLNEDGIIDARDASLLASHYGLAGD